ncbi:hypothetical protein IMZ48_12540 [Candidatus Bathyarchaeota archaeon]|nr:hypothetical protein [Candidatus Bathyarchaeota archaeon]
MVKNIHQSLTDALRGFAPEPLDKAAVAVGETQAQVLDRAFYAALDNVGSPKIGLRLSRRPDKFQIAPIGPALTLLLLQIPLDQRIRAAVILRVFGPEPIVDALGRMPLFESHPLILFQPPVDNRFPRVQFRRRSSFLLGLFVEILFAHVLGDRLPVDLQTAGDLQRSEPLSLQFFDLINLVHSEHVSSLQGILQGFPIDSSSRFLWGIMTIFLSISV